MKHCFFTLSIITFFILSFNTIEAQNHVPIDKGIIKGNFDIIFIDKNITLKPGEEFSLSKLGLEGSDFRIGTQYVNNWLTYLILDGHLKGYSDIRKLTKNYYQIRIHSDYSHKDYYGVIVFFKTNKEHKNDAVATSYEINIPDAYFDQANGDAIASSYEYVNDTHTGNPLTWLILFRDKP